MEKLNRRKQEFDQGFESIPLVKTKSEIKGDGIENATFDHKEIN